MPSFDVLQQPIGIIGAGAAGLIAAHTLLQDGFTDVTLITRDTSVGGTWARERVYSGLYTNNVHGEYRFSALAMPPPEQCRTLGGRLSGFDMCNYMEGFSRTFLEGKAKILLRSEVLDVKKHTAMGWELKIEQESGTQTLCFARIILATGGCSNPYIPDGLSVQNAEKAGFKGLVVHSSAFASEVDNILSMCRPASEGTSETPSDMILVVGGGKSSRDISAKLTQMNRNVIVVYDKADAFLAYKQPLPDFIRKSRILGLLAGHHTLKTAFERFLHQTWLGSVITSWVWKQIENHSFNTFAIPLNSPLRNTHSLFWNIRTSDEGTFRPDNYFALAQSGAIGVIAPARAVGYLEDGKSVLLSNGNTISPRVVVLATGYSSSWSKFIQPELAEEIGLGRHTPLTNVSPTWPYATLRQAPPTNPANKMWVTSNYRGLVPAKSIQNRDIAIMGSLFTENPGYTFEVCAHWVASYFRGDEMRLPTSVEDAIAKGEIQSAWMRTRYPSGIAWSNESYSGSYDFWSWPQAVDELLEDMYLPSRRSGGNWLTWPFKVIDLQEIASLTEERRKRRTQDRQLPR